MMDIYFGNVITERDDLERLFVVLCGCGCGNEGVITWDTVEQFQRFWGETVRGRLLTLQDHAGGLRLSHKDGSRVSYWLQPFGRVVFTAEGTTGVDEHIDKMKVAWGWVR